MQTLRNFLHFTGLKMRFWQLFRISNMIIWRNFIGPPIFFTGLPILSLIVDQGQAGFAESVVAASAMLKQCQCIQVTLFWSRAVAYMSYALCLISIKAYHFTSHLSVIIINKGPVTHKSPLHEVVVCDSRHFLRNDNYRWNLYIIWQGLLCMPL